MKDFIVDEVLHECLEAPFLVTDLLEVVEGREDDLVAALDQTDGCKQFQYQGLCSANQTSILF